jgi:ATP-dependent Clp protease ATP-binding subunit ClpA
LRWYDTTGAWVALERERTDDISQQLQQERQRAEQERQRAEKEQQKAQRLIEQLRSLGIEPDLGDQ